MTDLNKLRDD